MDSASAKTVLQRLSHALRWDQVPKGIRRIVIGVIGGTILLIGIALIVLPGPAVVVIPIGLAILATEFAWARHYLQKARGFLRRKNNKAAPISPEQK